MFPEGSSGKVLKALASIHHEGICRPVLLGYRETIHAKIRELELDDLLTLPIIQPSKDEKYTAYTEDFYNLRKRKGVLYTEAERLMADPYYFSSMAVRKGDAHGLISGAQNIYPNCVRPILQVIGTGRGRTASGLNIVLHGDRMIFLADTTLNIDPNSEQLAAIAIHAARVALYFKMEPRIAFLSYTNFSGDGKNPSKMKEAARLVKERHPEIMVDGEMQAEHRGESRYYASDIPFQWN